MANGDLKISLLRCTNKRRLHLTPKKLLPCTLKTCLLPAGFAVKSSSTGWPIRRWKERRWAPLARTKALKDRTSRGFGGGGGWKLDSLIRHFLKSFDQKWLTVYPSNVLKESINQLISKIWVGNYDKYKSTGVRPFLCLDGFYQLQKGAK